MRSGVRDVVFGRDAWLFSRRLPFRAEPGAAGMVARRPEQLHLV
jgi:hypothetical protein